MIPGRVYVDVANLDTYRGVKTRRIEYSIGKGRSCRRRVYQVLGFLVIVGIIIEG